MLALSIHFTAGRYHATPWERHVNEGAVSWPPEPWRLIRALIATWHHKVKSTGRHSEDTLRALIESLAADLPQYSLPTASHSHTRHYMPRWKPGDTSLVLDGFAAVAPDDPMYVIWPELDLPDDQVALLDELLAVIGYLGRAESWIEAARVGCFKTPDCMPGNKAFDENSGEVRDVVSLLAPLPAREYEELRSHFLKDHRAVKKLGTTLPDDLLDALSLETSDLRKAGWNRPPASRAVSYLRPVDALRPKRSRRKEVAPLATTVRYLLIGKPLPRVEDSVRIGELFRQALMSQSKQLLGNGSVPRMLSGHDLPGNNRHRHAFYLPFDSNEDGQIDRLLLHIPAGIGPQERQIAQRLRSLWSRDGSKWRIVLEAVGNEDIGYPLVGRRNDSNTVWESRTPYLHPWYVKKKFSIEDQLRRECLERGLPPPISVDRRGTVQVGQHERRPIHFHRFRSRRGLNQPDREGSFWRLTFDVPVQGPIALGFGCHFGLGLFGVVREASIDRIENVRASSSVT